VTGNGIVFEGRPDGTSWWIEWGTRKREKLKRNMALKFLSQIIG
jgi:hypothetical protein